MWMTCVRFMLCLLMSIWCGIVLYQNSMYESTTCTVVTGMVFPDDFCGCTFNVSWVDLTGLEHVHKLAASASQTTCGAFICTSFCSPRHSLCSRLTVDDHLVCYYARSNPTKATLSGQAGEIAFLFITTGLLFAYTAIMAWRTT